MKKAKRILALVTVFILVALYIATIVLAFIKHPLAERLFVACVYTSVVLPVLLYACFSISKFLTGKKD